MRHSVPKALAVALTLVTIVLAGCVGGLGDEAETGPTETDSPDGNDSDDGGDLDLDDDDQDEDLDGDDNETVSYRTPSDAMSVEPAETQEGMAHFVIEGQAKPMTEVPGVCASVGRFGADISEPGSPGVFPTIVNLTIDNPGDLTFFDIRLSASSERTDLSMTLKNSSGATIAEADNFGRTDEYLFWNPDQGEETEYYLEIWQSCADPTDRSFKVDSWVWTSPDWNAEHPWTSVWERRYDLGRGGVDTTVPCVNETAPCGPVYADLVQPLSDPVGVSGDGDGQLTVGGYSWDGCGTNGGGPTLLPCPREPYTSISVIIDDDIQGQEVAATFATCSDDGDNFCAETNNGDGPNELQATFCGVINGVTRDSTDDRDGTGPGIWDQRNENYKNETGYQDHPGVSGLVLFLKDPQEGGGGICASNTYAGPTSGTITIVATKG